MTDASAATALLYLDDAYLREFSAQIVAVDDGRVALDQTAFYATGGGQPHDLGVLRVGEESFDVREVRKSGSTVWHRVADQGEDLPGALTIGATVSGTLDWERRHQLMRTHTALHILCGVIWNEWGVSVTGGNMEPLSARMDFEFDPLPEGFAERITELVNAEISQDRPIGVSYLDRDTALLDDDLIRTKVNLIPEVVTEIRIVDIIGLDKQADGGTHVATTGEVGTFAVTKTESKGKGNKRVRIRLS